MRGLNSEKLHSISLIRQEDKGSPVMLHQDQTYTIPWRSSEN